MLSHEEYLSEEEYDDIFQQIFTLEINKIEMARLFNLDSKIKLDEREQQLIERTVQKYPEIDEWKIREIISHETSPTK